METGSISIKINFVKLFYFALIGFITVVAVKAFWPILGGVAAAFIIAYIFEPFINGFEKRHIGRGWGILTFFILAAITIYLSFYFIKVNFPKPEEITNFYLNIKKGIYAIKEILQQNINFINWQEVVDIIDGNTKDGEQVTKSLGMVLKSLAGTTTYLLVVPLCTLFIMISWHDMRKNTMAAIPNKYFEITYKILRDIDTIFGSYIRGIIIESFLIGAGTFAGLYLVGFPLLPAVILGIIAGVTNAVPYIGPWFGGIIGVFTIYMGIIPDGFVSFAGITADPLNTALVFFVVQLFDNAVVKPLVLGSAVNLHPIMIIVGVVAGGNLFGFIGVLFAIPVIAIINVSTRTLYRELKGYKMLKKRLFEIDIKG